MDQEMTDTTDVDTTKYPPNELIAKAHEFITKLEFELARAFLVRALEQDQQNSDAWRTLGEVECELDDIEEAKGHFATSIEVKPNHFAYLNLAQLSDTPQESLENFSNALSLLQELLTSEPTSLEYRRSASRALVGMTELYLTDLCFEENAEQECEKLLNLAKSIDPLDPEVHQTLASVRLSQSRPEDAKKCLQDAYNIWRDAHPDSPDIPAYDSRISFSRLLLETFLYSTAIEVLSRLVGDNDQDKQVHYLLSLVWGFVADRKSNQPSPEAKENPGDVDLVEEDYATCYEEFTTNMQELIKLTKANPEEDDQEWLQQLESIKSVLPEPEPEPETETDAANKDDQDGQDDVAMEA